MKFWLITVLAILVLVFGGISGWRWWMIQTTPVDTRDQNQINFVIAKQESAESVIRKLMAQKLVRSYWVTKLYLQGLGLDQKLRPGSYLLSRSQNLDELLAALVRGPQDVWITIPEGFRREQIALRFNTALQSPVKQFEIREFMRLTATAEGRLFPDTYLIPLYATSESIVKILMENFTAKVGEVSRDNLIIASIVEREVRSPADRPIVAGILLKRLEANWPLQVDATIQYARDSAQCQVLSAQCEWWRPLLGTKLSSAYNTYTHLGLPPGPIANPGLAVIDAVLHPQKTDYWYYLSDVSGVTHFAKNLNEHNLNIDKYLNN